MKLVNNLLSCAQRLLTFEGMALAAEERHRTADCGRDSPDQRWEEWVPRAGHGAAHPRRESRVGCTLGLAHKDVRLACELGVDSEVPMFFGNLTRELYQLCAAEMGRDAKVDTAALVVDRLASTHVVPPRSGRVSPAPRVV